MREKKKILSKYDDEKILKIDIEATQDIGPYLMDFFSDLGFEDVETLNHENILSTFDFTHLDEEEKEAFVLLQYNENPLLTIIVKYRHGLDYDGIKDLIMKYFQF